MFNFTDPSLLPKVTCSTVCSEGYEVTNLISKDSERKHRGFMVYNAIKPPVEVTFHLICSVDIRCIIIWPQVGNQRSCGIEIEAKVQKNNTENEKYKFTSEFDEFVTVGYSYFDEEPGVVFCRKDRRPFECFVPDGFVYKHLNNKCASLSGTESIRIKIRKTFNSTLAAIKKVEIWGKVSRRCSEETCQTVERLFKASSTVIKPPKHFHGVSKLPHNDSEQSVDYFKVPEDFLDSITHEIMSIPMILPCGKVVDQTTLEKHELSEAIWGRAPSDPFTGKLFSANSRPVLAASLKARIDKFLVDNAEKPELFTVARTSGRKQITSSLPSSKMTSKQSNYFSNNVASCKGLKHKLDINDDKAGTKRIAAEKCSITSSSNNTDVLLKSSSLLSSEGHVSYEEFLDSNLENAIRSTLSNLPSFLNDSNDNSNLIVRCCDCSVEEMLFILPCKHLFCKSCLLKKCESKELVCSVCKLNYKTSDPIRHHV